MKHLFLFLMLVSCSSEGTADWVREKIDPNYDPLPEVDRETPVDSINEVIEDFLYDCGEVYSADVSAISKLEYARYGDPSTEEAPYRAGLCTWSTIDGKLAKSNIIVKPLDSGICFKGLMYHELGHCVLGLDHTSQDPYTLMSPILKCNEYEENWDDYVEQLCGMRKTAFRLYGGFN